MTYVRWGELHPRAAVVPGALPLSLSRLTRSTQVCKPWRWELEARGFCGKTAHLCSVLVGGVDTECLHQNALRRLIASTDVDAERSFCSDGGVFLEKWEGRKGDMQEWLQAASQEPDASFLSRGAASTAQSLGVELVEWVGKPQGMYMETHVLPGHTDMVLSVAFSRDGKRAASGSIDKLVKIWNAETGAEVSSPRQRLGRGRHKSIPQQGSGFKKCRSYSDTIYFRLPPRTAWRGP